MKPGEYIISNESLELNSNNNTFQIEVLMKEIDQFKLEVIIILQKQILS